MIASKKARKLNNPSLIARAANTTGAAAIVEDQEMVPDTNITFQDLPWDVIEVVLDFIPLNDVTNDVGNQKVYHVIRLLNRDIYRMINARRKSLIFKDKQISERTFFGLIAKTTGRNSLYEDVRLVGRTSLTCNRRQIKQFGIMANLTNIKQGVFNKMMTPIKGLQQLELQNFTNNCLGEQGLNRLLIGC